MIEHVLLTGKPGEVILDHVTGKIVGRFDENGVADTRVIADNATSGLINRLKRNYKSTALED